MVAALEQRVRDAGLMNVRCEQADLYALRFEDGAFDAVVAANVLHLVPDLHVRAVNEDGDVRPPRCDVEEARWRGASAGREKRSRR